MKSKKLKPKRTKKGKVRKNKTRGGAAQEFGFGEPVRNPLRLNYSGNVENWNEGNQENWNRASSLGYRGNRANVATHVSRRANVARPVNNANQYKYDGDEDVHGEEDDIEQDYEDYQDYIEELTEGEGGGCTTTTLQEKLTAVEGEIENVSNAYEMLVQNIADKTLGEYIHTGSLKPAYSAELSRWRHNAGRRASQFQLISEEDLKRAFLYLLPSFDLAKKYMVMGENHEDTSMHVMIRHYAYKMITALFTRSNITYAVIKYDERESPHRFLENLLGVMRSASQITNQYLREDWATFLEIPIDQARYVHSGGNMIVMIAGMLCYLYNTCNSRQYQYNTYANTLLDNIRQEFETYLVRREGTVDHFYRSLTTRMNTDDVFRSSIKKNTEKISDLDLIFMAPDELVDNIGTNAYIFQISELTAYVLRKIMVAAHRKDGSPESTMAYHVMPFAGDFNDDWNRFKFANLSGVRAEAVEGMRALHEMPYYGYRQSSNLVEAVPMYLNRIKQGYQPFFDLNLSRIPEELQYEYSNKYGECIDCSIGDKTNHLYNHKQINYMTGNRADNITGNYYSLDTIIYELNYIIQGPRDDKYEKRVERRDFLMSIDNPAVNALFQIMGKHIT